MKIILPISDVTRDAAKEYFVSVRKVELAHRHLLKQQLLESEGDTNATIFLSADGPIAIDQDKLDHNELIELNEMSKQAVRRLSV